MYYKDNKTYLTSYDVKEALNKIVNEINQQENVKFHLVGLARGSFSILHEISNRCNLPYTILQYSSYDKNDKIVKNGFSSQEIEPDDILLIVDDIADTGNSINKTIDYLNSCFSWIPNIEVYTIVGGVNNNWDYYYNHKDFKYPWVVFPWENNLNEICKNCFYSETCNKYDNKVHCNIHNKSYGKYHSCKDIQVK